MPEVCLQEWETREANPRLAEDPLRGRTLDDPDHRAIAGRLGKRLRIYETRHGLGIAAEQFVGAVRLGDLDVRVRPKMAVPDLWRVVSYALGIEEVLQPEQTAFSLDRCDIVDVLGMVLLREAERLLRGGLRRRYEERAAWTGTPRGRIDVAALASRPPRETIPCRFIESSGNTPHNQAVRAGLHAARQRVRSAEIAGRLGRADTRWAEICERLPLSDALLDRVDRERNRLTEGYATAHRVVRWIHDGSGFDPEMGSGAERLPGVLWDMARLFEHFVGRFLQEFLLGRTVSRQAELPHLYSHLQNPQGRRLPRPRPDLVVREGRKIVGVFDTKYRDLHATALPREMLYQVSLYALAWRNGDAPVPATILYPQVGGARPELVLGLTPAGGAATRVAVRGIDWVEAGRLVQGPVDRAAAEGLARGWVA